MRPGQRSAARASSTRSWGAVAAMLLVGGAPPALGVALWPRSTEPSYARSLSGNPEPARVTTPAPRPTIRAPGTPAARPPRPAATDAATASAPITATPSAAAPATPAIETLAPPASPDLEPAPIGGRIPQFLRGKKRTRYMLSRWRELSGADLGEFAFSHLTGRTLHPGFRPLSMPIAAFKALPVLFPERFKDPRLADFGFLPDPNDPDDLPVGLKTGGSRPRYVEITCAACHAGLVRGRRAPGAPNDALRYGEFLLAWSDAVSDGGFSFEAVRVAAREAMGEIPGEDQEELRRWLAERPREPYRTRQERETIASWAAGRADYRSGAGAPARIPPLWGLDKRFMADGAWTDLGERDRWTLWLRGVPLPALRTAEADRLFGALADHVLGLRPPEAPEQQRRGLLLRGAEVFDANCASCHEYRVNHRVLVEEVGTDELLIRSYSPFYRLKLGWLGFRGVEPSFWPRLKLPALQGVAFRRLLLHNGSVPTLEDLLGSPDRRPPVFAHAGTTFDTRLPGHSNRGHTFGSDLEDQDREGLLAYLRSL